MSSTVPASALAAPLLGSAAQTGSVIWAKAVQDLTAQAVSVDDDATAKSTVPDGVLAYRPAESTSIDNSGVLIGQATSQIEATATSIEGSTTAYVDKDGTLVSSGVATIGLDLSGYSSDPLAIPPPSGSTTVGNATQILGSANTDATTMATTVNGDATAATTSAYALGIDLTLDGGGGASLTVGSDATIDALADSILNATASSVNGGSNASIDNVGASSETAGLYVGDGIIQIGSDGILRATANQKASATAVSVDGSTTSNPFLASTQIITSSLGIYGSPAATLEAGGNFSFESVAKNTQIAISESVGKTAINNGSSAFLSGTSKGVFDQHFTIGNNLKNALADATVIADAEAISIAGHSESTISGTSLGSRKSDYTVGDSATQGLKFNANSSLSSSANSTEGVSKSEVIGIANAFHGGFINVSGNSGLISATAVNTINSEATSISPSQDLGSGYDGQALATATSTTNGINTDKSFALKVGGDGSILATAASDLSAIANVVSGTQSNQFVANAQVTSSSSGFYSTPSTDDTVLIGGKGNLTGGAYLISQASANSINGLAPTSANTRVSQTGIELLGDSGNPDSIIIGENGSVSGISIVGGSVNSSDAKDPISTKATSVTGEVISTFESASGSLSRGILGDVLNGINYAEISAGPAGGNIFGTSSVNIELDSVNVGESALDYSKSVFSQTSLDPTIPLTSFGITSISMQGGMQGKNVISGTSNFKSSAQSLSVQGNTETTGNVISGGILLANPIDTDQPLVSPELSLSGTLQAVSQLGNSSMAKSIYGSSTTNLSGNSLGLLGYQVNLINNGNLLAISNSSQQSLASSIHSHASA